MSDVKGERAVRTAFKGQAQACRTLGSPFTARLCDLAAEHLNDEDPVPAAILGWQGQADSRGDSVPLRFAGGLHALVLSGQDRELAAVYPPLEAEDEALWSAVAASCRRHADFLLGRLKFAPQTNEVRRSCALMPALLTLAERYRLPFVLSEVGASAGLNLLLDRYQYRFGSTEYGNASPVLLEPEWKGPQPPQVDVTVADRRGCDLNPLDVTSAADRLNLASFIWADQADRLERTQAALDIAASDPPPLDRMDAVEWLASRLAEPHPGKLHVLFHTIAWQYFPPEAQTRGEELITEAGKHATYDAPFARLALEADDEAPGAGITLQVWPDGTRHKLGRADFHGRWVDWKGLA
jgi:hypothetical protein